MTDNKELVLNSNEPLTSQKPKKVVHIEMFKAGPQISSTGQKMMFTEKDLDQVVGTYSPEQHEAPLIIGHDQTDSTPALGWVKDLWRKGKKLWGKVELTPKAEQLIKDGVFKKVSSSFYLPEAETNPHPGKLALRHLGLVSIPAVKGLSAFSEGEANDEKIIDLVPQSGKTVISFKEALETNNSTMTKKKISDEVKEVSVDQNVDHAEGSMTVNINIGGGKPTVYDDSGNEVSETGAPADYQMEYADDEEEKEEMAPEASGEEESDDMGLEEEGGEEAPEASGDMEMPEKEEEGGEEPAGEEGEEDISGEMEDNDKKIASLAAEYEEDELFQALALKKQATSMMENDMSYAEAEGEKKEEEEEEKKEEADHAEEVVDNAEDKMEEKEEEEKKEEEADHSEEVVDNAEEHKEEEKEEEEEEKSDMAEEVKEEKKETADHAEEAAPLATESLDHSEAAIGDQSIDSLNARVAELEEELNKQRKLAREKEISSFAEGLYESGKLTEQVVPKGDLVRFMETLNHKNSVNFSETGKASQFDFMRGVLESLPSMVSFEEFATPASAPKQSKSVEPNASGYAYDPNTADVHADALSYAEENGCDYLTAVKFVINNN
ncbi:virion structural protein and packaging [Cyanophage S-TIM5]|uniref:Virion structural protein and packaging n=1 Tax=Cyanophage S-TIM5 TaxID=1137745 RepID=H6WFT6_9CAUD|nr:head maturation protease [Cyanophage S-TIM5]AEZ65661.1 virion structural protein and packaging [Cyanophage S-TIM5]UYE96829.1 virion structural protein [Cyanophage S-TIM66]UYE97042.1 virion structural protein [Cyanophage S-TIM61]